MRVRLLSLYGAAGRCRWLGGSGCAAQRRDGSPRCPAGRDDHPRPRPATVPSQTAGLLAQCASICASSWCGVGSCNRQQAHDIVLLDVLDFWKLGIVRMIAQRFPYFLQVACAGSDACLGPVPDTLEALWLHAWEMVHLCVPAPAPLRYVCVHFTA